MVDKDKKQLVFNSEGDNKFTVKHGRRAEIPCKVTHPDVRVTLKRSSRVVIEPFSKVRCYKCNRGPLIKMHGNYLYRKNYNKIY
jgi:hypothetical protein